MIWEINVTIINFSKPIDLYRTSSLSKKLTDFKFKGRASLRKSKYFTIELYAYEHMQCYLNNNNNDKVIRDIIKHKRQN